MPKEFLSSGRGLSKVVEHQVQRHKIQERMADELAVGNELDNVVKFQDEVVNEVVNLDVPKSSRFIQGNDFMPSK